MSIIIPILACILCEALFLAVRRLRGRGLPSGAALIPYALIAAGVTIFELLITALGYSQDVLPVTVTVIALTLGACAVTAHGVRRAREDGAGLLFGRIGLAALIAAALELSVFAYSAYAAPTGGASVLDAEAAQPSYDITYYDDAWHLSPNTKTRLKWSLDFPRVRDISLTFYSPYIQPLDITVSVLDKNFSTFDRDVYSSEYIISGETTVTIPLSSRDTKEIWVSFGKAYDVSLRQAALNAPKTLSPNLLRLLLLIALLAAAVSIATLGLHRTIYEPKNANHRMVAVMAATVCCLILLGMGICHVNDRYSQGSLLREYDSVAEGRDPYYQQFDAFQKGRLDLDIEIDERLADAGELAYDSSWRGENDIVEQWDRAYYDGRYYSYFGIAPLILVYYPIYFLTGMVPTAALGCLIFSLLCVIFGFMLVFRIARVIVGRANLLLTLLAAAALPLASGIYLLMGYGDFYSLPKLCATSFLLLLWNLSIEGYERPGWHIFLLCGLCSGAILASRPNLALTALSLAPLYIGVLTRRELRLSRKLTYVALFALPIIAVGAGLMAYNAARFGSPLEFGTRYQMTVSNVALNELTPGFIGMALYYYFAQPAALTPVFPYISPQQIELLTCTKYIYVTASYGVLNLPLTWSIAAYPSLRKRSALRPAYRTAALLCVITAALTAWIDFCMAGVTISYVCDIAVTVAIASVILLLSMERSAGGGANRWIYPACVTLLTATIVICGFLLLSTAPQFVKYHMTALYGAIQGIFTF